MLFQLFIIASIAQLFQEISSTQPDRQGRIINGYNISLGEVPYQISLISKSKKDHICGAVIITEYYALTAAHCFWSVKPKEIFLKADDSVIIAGTTDLRHPLAVYDVSRTILHENYNPNNLRNDIALIKVVKPFKFNEYVAPAKLSQFNDQNKYNVKAMVSGFGYTSLEKLPNPILMGADLLLVSHKECTDYYTWDVDETNNICVKGIDGKQGWCNGDSGGPIIVDGKVIGLVSWAGNNGCYVNGQIQVGTRVSSFFNWITSHIDNTLTCSYHSTNQLLRDDL